MPYDHTRQHRCPIVRGKALTDLDDLLPAYANILQEICPSDKVRFKQDFNKHLDNYLSISTKKTLDNHRTEIAGKLFGMYYEDSEEVIHISERTLKLLEDSDQPAFFKDLCAKYQFPSGMNKIHTVRDQISRGVNVRQLSFVMKVALEFSKANNTITKKEVGYYILNSLDVISGKATPDEVILQISKDRINEITREVKTPNKYSSYDNQHINEQLKLLALANCITFNGQNININNKEMSYINSMADKYNTPPSFNFYSYDLSTADNRKKAELDWDNYFSTLSDLDIEVLSTSTNSLVNIAIPDAPQGDRIDTMALGDDGEEYVYKVERSRIENDFPRLVNKIKKLGKIKGLGYDIQSVLGHGPNAAFAKYIEVKSTKRVTAPSDAFSDTVNLTRNEWTAAQQHKQNFFIYRVYFSQKETKIFIIENPFELNEQGKIYAVPLNYRVDFNQNSGAFYANA